MVGRIVGRQDYNQYTETECHAELVYAECLLLKVLLGSLLPFLPCVNCAGHADHLRGRDVGLLREGGAEGATVLPQFPNVLGDLGATAVAARLGTSQGAVRGRVGCRAVLTYSEEISIL